MLRKFEKFKARRKRKGKEGGLGTKYITFNNVETGESKTYKNKLKRPKHEEGKPKVKKHRQTTDNLVNNVTMKSTNQMMDLRPLIVEVLD